MREWLSPIMPKRKSKYFDEKMRTDQADREPVSPALSDRGPFRAGFVRQVGAASANRSRGDREEGRGTYDVT